MTGWRGRAAANERLKEQNITARPAEKLLYCAGFPPSQTRTNVKSKVGAVCSGLELDPVAFKTVYLCSHTLPEFKGKNNTSDFCSFRYKNGQI